VKDPKVNKAHRQSDPRQSVPTKAKAIDISQYNQEAEASTQAERTKDEPTDNVTVLC
jgi:hypothetical protein